MTELNLSDNVIRSVPPDFGLMNHLVILDLSGK